MKIRLLIALVIIIAAASLAFFMRPQRTAGGLRWEKLSQSFDLPAGSATHRSTFYFQNVSGKQLAIENVRPDCNCLVPQLKNTTLAPGESSELDVVFDPGDRAGTLTRTIEVQTKEFPKEPTKLTLTYHIPELIRVSHRLLMWSLNSKPETQEISLQMPDQIIRVTGVRTSNDSFECKVVPVQDGKEYKIQVTPVDASTARQSILLIDTDYPKAPWNRIVANVKIE